MTLTSQVLTSNVFFRFKLKLKVEAHFTEAGKDRITEKDNKESHKNEILEILLSIKIKTIRPLYC